MDSKEFFVGLDLGQARDYSALCAVERVLEVSLAEGAMLVTFNVRHLEIFPLGTPYSEVVETVGILMQQPELAHHTTLVIDETGVGRPVMELFQSAGMDPVGITITGGPKVTSSATGYVVPKAELVDALTVRFQNGRIKISPALDEAEKLKAQLEAFTVKINKRGRETFEAMDEEIHDDLVLALSLAIWLGDRNGVSPDDFSSAGDDEGRNQNFNYLTGELE